LIIACIDIDAGNAHARRFRRRCRPCRVVAQAASGKVRM